MIYRVSINSADSRVLPVLVPAQYFLATAKLCLFMRSCYQPLFQKHVHSVANILPDRQAKVCLYGELVRAIAHGHKRTSKRMPINLCKLPVVQSATLWTTVRRTERRCWKSAAKRSKGIMRASPHICSCLRDCPSDRSSQCHGMESSVGSWALAMGWLSCCAVDWIYALAKCAVAVGGHPFWRLLIKL